jgi:hypothetical protein
VSTIDEQEVSHEAIARRAYELWQARGCPMGDGTADWQAAEAELRAARRWSGRPILIGLRDWWQRLRRRRAA